MTVAPEVCVDDVFFGELNRFHRLALALSGNADLAEKILVNVYERASEADQVRDGWHARWVKHCLIRSSIEFLRAQDPAIQIGAEHSSAWSDSLPAPFRADMPRILFVLRVWEGLPFADVCRYCGLSRSEAAGIMVETWRQVNERPEWLEEFAAALMDPVEQTA